MMNRLIVVRNRYLVSVVSFLCLLMAAAGAAEESAGVSIGTRAEAVGPHAVAVGRDAKAIGYPDVAKGTAAQTLAVGYQAQAAGWRCTAVGALAQAHVVSATAIGRGAYAHGAHMIAIGRGAYMEKVPGSSGLNQQNGCGIAGDSLWLGGKMGHKYIDVTGDTYVHQAEDGGDGKARWNIQTNPPKTYTIHGMDAYDCRFDQDPERFQASLYRADDKSTWVHRMDKDVAGGSLVIAAGRGTGTADGGAIELQTAPAGTESQNRKNALQPGLRIDTEYQAKNATPMLLWDNNARKLKRVYVGAPDSGGPGFRALVIEN